MLLERNYQDRYNDPGSVMTEPNARGRSVMRFNADGSKVFVEGDGAPLEALTALAPERAGHTLVHIAYPDDLSGASAQAFREAAVKAGAIGSLSFPKRAASHIYKATRKLCALQIRSTKIRRVKETRSGGIVSALKDCPFVLDIQFPAAERDKQEGV